MPGSLTVIWWQEDGALDAAQRANAIRKQSPRENETPPPDEAIDEALQAQRRASMPESDA